jgi:GT2 family glycosyltransferase
LNNDNYGFAKGNNVLYEFASTTNLFSYYLLLNNDTIVTSKFLFKLISTAKTNPNISAVSGRIIDASKPTISSFGGYISYLRGSGYLYSNSNSNNITFLSGCLMLIKASVIKEVGLFDENYFLYLEDVDLCFKFIKHGKVLAVNPDSIILHKESQSTGKKSNLTIYYNFRNRLYFIRKNQKNIILKIVFYFFFISSRLLYLFIRPHLYKIYRKSFLDFYSGKFGEQSII